MTQLTQWHLSAKHRWAVQAEDVKKTKEQLKWDEGANYRVEALERKSSYCMIRLIKNKAKLRIKYFLLPACQMDLLFLSGWIKTEVSLWLRYILERWCRSYLCHKSGPKATLVVIGWGNPVHDTWDRIVCIAGPAATWGHVEDLCQQLWVQTQPRKRGKPWWLSVGMCIYHYSVSEQMTQWCNVNVLIQSVLTAGSEKSHGKLFQKWV